jgi:hypothetical protein
VLAARAEPARTRPGLRPGQLETASDGDRRRLVGRRRVNLLWASPTTRQPKRKHTKPDARPAHHAASTVSLRSRRSRQRATADAQLLCDRAASDG